MKKSAAVLSPLVIACLTGIASAEEGNIEFVESYTEAAAPSSQAGSVAFSKSIAQQQMQQTAKHLAAFNAVQGGGWKADIDRKNGQVKVLYGSMSKRFGDTPERAAKNFLKESSAVFGLRNDLADIKISKVNKTAERDHVVLQQTHEGIPVDGAVMLVHSNKQGQITMAQNSYASDVVTVNSRKISKADAVTKALDDLKSSLGGAVSIGKSHAEELIEPVNGKYYFIWKVKIRSRNPLGQWVYYINSENQEILGRNNEIMSLRNGYGRVYKNNKDWIKGKLSVVPLRNLFTDADGYITGALWGKHADVFDYNGTGDIDKPAKADDPYAPNLRFFYNPYGREKNWFDATSAYYQVDNVWAWWRSNILLKYGPRNPDYFYSLSIPVIVNAPMCNAYYEPELSTTNNGQYNYPPALWFGNEEQCYSDSEDFVLDEEVVTHEFTHAMMEWSYFGRQFGGAVNGYGRAMGEGNADWFSYLRFKDPLMGDVAFAYPYAPEWYLGHPEWYLRNLDNNRMYPADVEAPYYGATYKDKDGNEIIIHNLPEEHYTGEIWGGYLYDLSQVLKGNALKYVYQGMYYFSPEGGSMGRRPDFYDAISAQAMAEKDLTKKLTNTVKAWGAMSSRGLLGSIRSPYSSDCYFPPSLPVCQEDKISQAIICTPCPNGNDLPAYFSLSFSGKATLSTQGRFLKPGVCNEYPIAIAKAGLHLKAKVTGTIDAAASSSSSPITPALTLYNNSVAVVAASAGSTSNGTTEEAVLEASDLPASSYTIMACGLNTGKYTFQVATALQ